MTLHRKVLIIIVITFIGLISIMHTFAKIYLMHNFTQLEKSTVERDVQRALSALYDDIGDINGMAFDYANWDDTYQFMEDRNIEFTRSNFINSNFEKCQLNLVALVNNENQVIYHKEYDAKTENSAVKPAFSRVGIFSDQRFLDHIKKNINTSGILATPDSLWLIVSRGIFTTESTGQSRGRLVMGRKLNEIELKRLSLKTHLTLNVLRLEDVLKTLGLNEERFIDNKTILTKRLNEKKILGYAAIHDIYGNPALVMRVDTSRDIYLQGRETVRYFAGGLAVCGIVYLGVILGLLRSVVLSRIGALNRNVGIIAECGDFTARIAVSGEDEVADLGKSINNMLKSLEYFHENEERYVNLLNQLSTAHEQVSEIIDFLPDATLVIDIEHRIIAWNNAMERMTSIPKEEMLGRGDYCYAMPFYGQARPVLIDYVLAKNSEIEDKYEYIKRRGNTFSAEIFVSHLYAGKGACLMVTASPLYDNRGNCTGAIESIRDITDRKEAIERQRYISLHDSLTGLYNRTYFEQLMQERALENNQPFGIIICDVDGLKIINDTMGHRIGDELLLTVAGMMKKHITPEDTVARVGGDEFAILLMRRTKDAILDVIYRIRNDVEEYNQANTKMPISMSIGYATSTEFSTFADVFREADNNMLRQKLHHSQSNRSSIVHTMMKALEARDFVTEGHAERMQEMIAEVGEALELGERRIADLRLLAQFHDIGKVGTPDRILFKQGPLNTEEYEEMKRHCEIGYEIALSAPELRPIAGWILKHHEKWDGTGYPLGIKGEDIPLECRIIALADAYDAMINDRPYRKALPHRVALEELKKCAGTQFDPQLVGRFCEVLNKKLQ